MRGRGASSLAIRWLSLAAAALFALALAGCGGDDEEAVTTTATPPSSEAQARAGNPGTNEVGQTGGGEGASPDAPPSADQEPAGPGKAAGARRHAPGAVDLRVRPASIRGARVTATGAVQTLPPSGQAQQIAQENAYGSIRSFGSEADGQEATNITFALVQYLTAKAAGDWSTACARIYSVLRQNLEKGGASCVEAFGGLMSRTSEASRAEQARIDVSSIRRGEGNRAFVIYKTPETLSADMPMYVEDGIWKVAAIEAYALRSE